MPRSSRKSEVDQTSDPSDGGWTAVPDCGEPAERLALRDLDLLSEATHPIRGAILRRLREPRTVAELAELLDVPITRLYHHINRLNDLELIRVVATRKVAAVTERRYQVVAKSLHVDHELLEATDERELAVALCSLFDVAKLGFQRFVEHGGLRDIDEDDEHAVLSLGEIHLSPRRRHELMQRLQEVVEEFPSDVSADEGNPVTMLVAAYEEPS